MTYVDSDGVLADFAGWIEAIKPGALNDNDEVYRILISHCDEAYLDFKKVEGSEVLFENIKTKDDWFVLTAVPNPKKLIPFKKDKDERALTEMFKENKYIWFEKHGIPRNKVIIVESAQDKASFCKPGDILYDDYRKNIASWAKSGGIGILTNPRS